MRNFSFDDRLLEAVSPFGKKYLDLFRRAIRRSNTYFEQLLSESVYFSGADGSAVYHCVADRKKVAGRNHLEAARLHRRETEVPDYQFFSNAMTVAEVPASGEKWSRPMSRSALGNVIVFTFEWDREGSFLFDQLDRCFPLKTPADSRYGKLSSHLAATYADYDSMAIVYSGNRSLHVHIVFRTDLFRRDHGDDLSPEAVNAGHKASWDALLPLVEPHLAYPAGDGPDTSLKTHVSFRRMPNAVRTIDKPNHPLGLLIGERVPQVIVWEDRIQRRSPEVCNLFLTPSRFFPPVTSRSPSRSRKTDANTRHIMTAEQSTYCEDQMRDILLDTPFLFDRFAIEGDVLVARLHNGPEDENAATIMKEAHDKPLVLGKGSGTIGDFPVLPLSLGEMVREWCREYDVAQPFDASALSFARTKLGRFLPFWIEGHRSFLLRATEGLGKSTGIMANIALDVLTQSQSHQPSMFATGTYVDAADKCHEFNARQPEGSRHVGIFLTSYRELYEGLAKSEGSPVLKYEDADKAKLGFREFIETTQPEVAAAMRVELELMWSAMKGRTPVIFTQHSVAHLWAENSLTRQMFSPAFYDADFDPHRSKRDTSLNWLVHDEASIETFIDLYSPNQWRWLELLAEKSSGAWSGSSGARQRAAYARHHAAANKDHAVDSFAASRALRGGLETFDTIVVKDACEYFTLEDDVRQYHCDGDVYRLKVRDWWIDGDEPVANRIMYLTTEAVPAMVATKACPNLAIKQPVFPIGRDRVTVVPMKFSADKVPALAAKDLAAGKLVISNRLERAPGTLSPKAARGVNGLDNRDIVQYAYLSPPPVYKACQAINTWLGRDDVARVSHIDEIQQGFGRNRGPRNAGAEHTLKISRTLYRTLLSCDTAMSELRYQLDVGMDKNARREGRRAA